MLGVIFGRLLILPDVSCPVFINWYVGLYSQKTMDDYGRNVEMEQCSLRRPVTTNRELYGGLEGEGGGDRHGQKIDVNIS